MLSRERRCIGQEHEAGRQTVILYTPDSACSQNRHNWTMWLGGGDSGVCDRAQGMMGLSAESAALGVHLCGVWFPCDVFLSPIKIKTSSPLCELRSIVNLTECGIFWEMELWACLWGGYHDCVIWDGNASPQREAPFHGSRTGWKGLSKPRTCVHCFFFQLSTQWDHLSGLCCSVTSLPWRTII